MPIPFIANTAALTALAQASAPGNTAPPCAGACEGLSACVGWESITEDRWPASMQHIATLRDPELYEPTFEEFHQGTRYDSADAPVALKYFPYNRCDVWRCTCGRLFLRYTEFGGYYVDHRVRALNPARIVEAP